MIASLPSDASPPSVGQPGFVPDRDWRTIALTLLAS